ncbi:hypothetical protein VTL71DRAFT_7742 [Oculimacula yallundae]|uniref:Uncharacterized protein n=1 Tax=Oculimacula yallundae TaxID=86028 RepID=A0ABR4CVM4_9HELO
MKTFVTFGILLFSFLTLVATQDAEISEELSQHVFIEKSGEIYNNPEFKISCIGCSLIGDLSFSGGCDDTSDPVPTCIEQRAPNANFSMLPVDFEKYWLGVAFDDFKLHIELDISLTPTNPTNEVIIHLIGEEGIEIPFNKGGPFETVFTFDPQIHGWVNSTVPVNFTYGFDFTIPPHSALWVPVLHLDSTSTFGFNESTIVPTEFKSKDANLQFDFELSFRPVISAAASFLEDVFSETITLYADVPQVNLAVSQAQSVTNDCKPAPAGTDETHFYKNLTHIVPVITTDFGLSVEIPEKDFVFGPYSGAILPTQCLGFDAKSTSLTAAAVEHAKSSAVAISPVMLSLLMGLTLGFIALA